MMRCVAVLAMACLMSEIEVQTASSDRSPPAPCTLPFRERLCFARTRRRAAPSEARSRRVSDVVLTHNQRWQASGVRRVSPALSAGLTMRLRGGGPETALFERALQSNDAGAVSDAVDGILGMKIGRENLRGGERPEPPFRGGARGEAEFRMLQAIENNDACAFEAAVGLALVRMPRVLSVLLLFSAFTRAHSVHAAEKSYPPV